MDKALNPGRSRGGYPLARVAPIDPPLHRLVQAQQMLAAGQVAKARELLQGVLEHAQARPEAHYLLGIAAVLETKPQAGLEHAAAAAAEMPNVPRYQFALGRVHKACGDAAAAEAAYRRAIALDPNYADAHVSLGIVLKNRGKFDDAIGHYQTALRLNPRLASAHANLANALALRAESEAGAGFDGEIDPETVDSLGRAVALDPKNALLHRNYGVMLRHARRYREALAAFNETLSLDPADVQACLRLGQCLVAVGKLKVARDAYEKWLGMNPPSSPVMRSLSGLLMRDGQADAAIEWAHKAAKIDEDPSALSILGSAFMQARRLDEALDCCRRAVEQSGRRSALYPMLLLGVNYLREEPEPILEAHAEYGASFAPPAEPQPVWRPLQAGRPLRVGYVSGDFVRHSVSYFIGGLLEHHDKQRFEIWCYHNIAWGDAVTDRFKALGHHWVECEGMSDSLLRRRILDDGIDVLVDLSGHTAHSRASMFALRAAPVQVSYLGYPTVCGLRTIDFRITDNVIDPGDMPALRAEQPLRLPRSMFCYRPDEAPDIGPPPATSRGYITFGSFNNIAKISDHTLELWASVMNRVPGSRLLLKSSSMAQASNRSNIESFMAERGVAAERLSLQAQIASKSGHLGLYNEVDIALDPFPYNGATTTCEALWMGVPVLSRRGRTHTSRMGASILGAIGKSEWLADDDAGYVERAGRLAQDLAALVQWRQQARAHLAASPLFDETGFSRDFETLLERAWQLGASRPRPAPATVTA